MVHGNEAFRFTAVIWTYNQPTVDGYYWMRSKVADRTRWEPRIWAVRIVDGESEFYYFTHWRKTFFAEWAGPIEQPTPI
jgi:hypothetical protein